MKTLPAFLVALVVAGTRLRAIPRTFWQAEEVGFTRALLTFDPLQRQPEAPGYPLVVALGKLVSAFVHDPFASLIGLSVVASIAGAVMLTFAFARILDDEWCGAAGATLVWLSPAMLAFTPLPNAEAVAMALIAATLLTYARGDSLLFGICAGAAVAARPQAIVAALALILFARNRRAIVAFVITLVIAFEPLLEVIGSRLPEYFPAEAVVSGRELGMRIVAHSWGMKFLSLPLLALALAGAVLLIRRSDRRVFGVALFAAAHVAVYLVAGDRSTGVQPLLPALVAPALFATAALRPLSRFALSIALAYGAGALVYSEPLVARRSGEASPAAAAVAHVARSLPQRGVVVYEPSMEAFARNAGFASAPVAQLNAFAARPDIPILLLADGGSRMPGARTFAWPDSDVYGKVTTEHYRVVSVIPIPPSARYVAAEGVYQLERTADGREWRWLAQRAVLSLPAQPGATIHLTFALPAEAPVSNSVAIDVNGERVATLEVLPGATPSVNVPVVSGAPATLLIRSARVTPGVADTRALAVQLIGVER